MKIYTKLEYHWSDTANKYVLDNSESIEYTGIVGLMCGASAGQKASASAASALSVQMAGQATAVFGASSAVYTALSNAYSPIVAAGPSQQGFSAQEASNLNSEAITQTGTEYKNDKEALGNAQAAQGGGNVALPSGTTTAADEQLAANAGNQTASELSQITQKNYDQGNANYNAAVAGEANLPNVYDAANSAGTAAVGASQNAGTQQNAVSQQNNSWMSLVGGALGDVAGVASAGLQASGSSGVSGIVGGMGNGNASQSALNGAINGPGGGYATVNNSNPGLPTSIGL
jgi:hypothetical protein